MTDENLMTVKELIERLSHAHPDAKVHIGPADNRRHLSVYRLRYPDDETVYIELNEIVHVTHD